MDRGHRDIVYVPNVYVPFLARMFTYSQEKQEEHLERALSGALPRAPRFLNVESSRGIVGNLPVLGALAGQQTRNTKSTTRRLQQT